MTEVEKLLIARITILEDIIFDKGIATREEMGDRYLKEVKRIMHPVKNENERKKEKEDGD